MMKTFQTNLLDDFKKAKNKNAISFLNRLMAFLFLNLFFIKELFGQVKYF